MKNVFHFLRVIFVKPAEKAAVFSEFNATFDAIYSWLLYLLTTETFHMLNLLKQHAIDLTALFKLKLLVMTDFARIIDSTTWRLDAAYND